MEAPVYQWIVPWTTSQTPTDSSSRVSHHSSQVTKSSPNDGQLLVDCNNNSLVSRRRGLHQICTSFMMTSSVCMLSTILVLYLSLASVAAGPAPGPVSAAELSPVDMMRKFQGWAFVSSSSSHDDSRQNGGHSSSQLPASSRRDPTPASDFDQSESSYRGKHSSSWSHSKGSSEVKEEPVDHENEKAHVTNQERRLEAIQNNPGAWGISDFQDNEFLRQYLQNAKENFGDKLEDNLQPQQQQEHLSSSPSKLRDSILHDVLQRRISSDYVDHDEQQDDEHGFSSSAGPLAGFIRVPHLPHTWYTAETHEPMDKKDDEPSEDQEPKQEPLHTPITDDDLSAAEEKNSKKEPFIFYSDWTRPNHTIEKHLAGSLDDHILDVESENGDLPYQEPNIGCLAAGSNFCSIEQDFPKAIMSWIDEKFADILSNFSLPNTPESEAGGPLFAASRDYVSPDDAPCESQRSDLQPSWVRDEKTGSWVLVVQTMSLQQWIRLEECLSKDVSCQYVMPYYGSVCREKSTLHQLVAWNPSTPEMLSFAYFKAPNGCECHILNSFHHDQR